MQCGASNFNSPNSVLEVFGPLDLKGRTAYSLCLGKETKLNRLKMGFFFLIKVA